MTSRSPSVWIILVNWNTETYLLTCLKSLERISYLNYKILVVDNASTDDSLDVVAITHPQIELIRLPMNAGFTGANNIGIQRALEQGAEFVYLLNCDTYVRPDFLDEVIRTALSDPCIGIVGSKVYHAANPKRLQFVGLRANLNTGYHGHAFGYNQLDRGQYDHISDVDLIGGCAMLISRACLEATKGLDDAFFAFYEDFDLCLRARAYSFRVVMSPHSHVWHEGGSSMGGAASAGHMYYGVRNNLRLVSRHKPLANRGVRLLRALSIIGAHTMQVLLNRPSLKTLCAVCQGARDYRKGVTGLRT